MPIILVLLFAVGVYRFFPRIAKGLVGLTLALALLVVVAIAGIAGVAYYQYRQAEAQRTQGHDFTPELFGTATPDEAAQRLAALRQRLAAAPTIPDTASTPLPLMADPATKDAVLRFVPFLITVWWFWTHPNGRLRRKPRVEVEPTPGVWLVPAQPRGRTLMVVPSLPTPPVNPAWSAILKGARDYVRFYEDNVRAHPHRQDYREGLARAEQTLATHLRNGGPG